MSNIKIYIITIIISVILMIPSCFWDINILNALSGIGCSGLAASIIAIYIERNTVKKEEAHLSRTRTLYFKQMNNQLNMIFERILWFDARMNDLQFNWSLQPQEYSSFKYMIWAGKQYKEEGAISFEEAETRLKKIGEKYNLQKQTKMSKEELQKVQKMFCIIANSGNYLLSAANEIKENKLMLDRSEYLALEEIDTLLSEISFGIGIMNTANKNYSVAIDSLLSASKIIRKVGQYTDSICIGLHGSIQITEL